MFRQALLQHARDDLPPLARASAPRQARRDGARRGERKDQAAEREREVEERHAAQAQVRQPPKVAAGERRKEDAEDERIEEDHFPERSAEGRWTAGPAGV